MHKKSKKNFRFLKRPCSFKYFLYTFLFSTAVILLFSCSNSTNPEMPPISVTTDQNKYLQSDTITVFLKNNSTDVYYFGLRCGGYLEMFYQKLDEGKWSENKWFFYMSLKCYTAPDSLKTGEQFSYKLPAQWFEDSGSFRLVLNDLYSNTFTIDPLITQH